MEETTQIATRLLGHIRSDLLETDESFGPGLDSMSIMQIILFIEEAFAVKLPDDAVTRATFCSARHLAEAIRERTSLEEHLPALPLSSLIGNRYGEALLDNPQPTPRGSE